MEKVSGSWRRSIGGQVLELLLLLFMVFLIRTFGFGLYQVPSGSMETTMLVGERFFADKLSYWFRDPVKGDIIACNAPTFHYSSNAVKRFIEKYIWGPDNWTKRVIGVPGDHVKGVIENGKPIIYLNGKKLEEPYLNKCPLVEELQGTKWEHKSYDPSKPFNEQPFYRINERFLKRDAKGTIILEYPDKAHYFPVALPTGARNFYGYNADQFDVTLGSDEYWLMGDNRRGSGDSRSWGPVKRSIIHGRIIFRIWSVDSYESWWIADLIRHPIDFWKRVRWSRFFQFIG